MTTSCCGAFAMPVELPERGMPLPREEKREFRLTGWHVLAMLVTFFAIVASVNFYMMTTAIRTMPGLDARNGYDVSQNFNRAELAAAEAQTRRGWQSDAHLALSNRMLDLSVRFRDRESKALDGLAVTAVLQHPAQRGGIAPSRSARAATGSTPQSSTAWMRAAGASCSRPITSRPASASSSPAIAWR